MTPVKHAASFEDVVRSSDTMVAELLDGDLYLRPRNHDQEHLWEALCQTYLHDSSTWRSPAFAWQPSCCPLLQLGEDLLAPEACAWASRDLPPHTRLQADARHIEVTTAAPAWVLELLTPETAALVREKKLVAYLRAGVSTVWLLDPQARRCEVLIADGAEWRQHQICGEHGRVRLRPFECAELHLDEFWDTREQKAQKRKELVDELGRALDAALARGDSEDALFTILLKALDVQATPFDEKVIVPLLCSESVLLRARALVACRTPIRQARQVAREELAATHHLRMLAPSEADALCERFCELLKSEGPHSIGARELAVPAHVWARNRLCTWWHPRQDRDLPSTEHEQSVAGLHEVRRFAKTGTLSDRARTVVMSGPGAWRVSTDNWNTAVGAVIAELEVEQPLHDSHVERLIAALAAHLPERADDRAKTESPRSFELDPEFDSDEVVECGPHSSRDTIMRPMEDDIALEWQITRREIALEMTELRETGRLLPRLDWRLATGHGLSLLSEEEHALAIEAGLERSLADE